VKPREEVNVDLVNHIRFANSPQERSGKGVMLKEGGDVRISFVLEAAIIGRRPFGREVGEGVLRGYCFPRKA